MIKETKEYTVTKTIAHTITVTANCWEYYDYAVHLDNLALNNIKLPNWVGLHYWEDPFGKKPRKNAKKSKLRFVPIVGWKSGLSDVGVYSGGMTIWFHICPVINLTFGIAGQKEKIIEHRYHECVKCFCDKTEATIIELSFAHKIPEEFKYD